ncbi:uncharacterized protein LOC101694066 [Mustela putorius furo]|uniref:Uncharacterized protein LOC101694066 n=2 Tax=Mustela putorius furo TaxID=9669 RepID=A0A8U0N0Q4_MUSPF|nr:uncharacterized protein LOC101694066 [Mustela putorius furo]
MNSSSENNAHFEGSNARPFFYVHAVGQQTYPSPWYQNPSYNPFCVPGAGFRNGSLYFPYSVILSESPGFLIPQSPLPTAFNRRPMFCNTAQFQQCSAYGKKTKTKETQTEPHQAENKTQKQDTHSEGDMVTSIPTSNSDTETENIPQATDGVLSSVAQKQQLPGESPSPNTVYRASPQVNYASEKGKMGLEQRKGSPVTQFWKTLKETIHLYDLAYGKAMPDIMVQHGGISQSSWENRSVLHNHHEGADGIMCKDKESTLWSEQCHCVRRDEVVKSGSIVDMNLGKEKGYAAVLQFLSSLDEAKDRGEIQDTLNSNLCQSSGDGDKLQQERPVCSSNKAIEDLSLESKIWSPIHFGESMLDNSSGGRGFPVKVGKGEVVESNSYPENYVLPPTSLAQFSHVDEGIQCDVSQWQDAEHEKSPEPSSESRKATEEFRCGELEEVVEWNSCSKHVSSSACLAQMNSRWVDEGIQCDRSWWQDAHLEISLEQMPSNDEESFPDCKTKGSRRRTIRNGRLNTDEEEMTMNDEIEEEDHENFKKCTKIKKTVKGRKQKSLRNFSSGNTVYLLKKNGALNTVLPNDSEDCDLEEEAEDEMYEIECLLEEVSPLGCVMSSKGKIYGEVGRIIRMPAECSLPPQLIVWCTRKKYMLKLGEYESIPVVCKVTGQDGRFQGERTMAVQEGLQSKRVSPKPWE